MTNSNLHIDFATLRQAYNAVKAFIEEETFEKVDSLKTKIEDDLGCSGDNNWDLLQKFVTSYKFDTTGFDYSKHFMSEAELFDSSAAFLSLVGLPIFLIVWTIKILSFGNLDWTKRQLFPDWQRNTLDLTFGDMLTWYLTGKYNLRKDIYFQLVNHA